MVTMQYSKRPSPLSLFKIDDAREQNRLLWLAISARLRERGRSHPRVVLFGESLGAHTSPDVLLHWGTLGLRGLGIDRALWVGTPTAADGCERSRGAAPDVDPDLVAVVNDVGQLEAMTPERRRPAAVRPGQPRQRRRHQVRDLIASRPPAWLTGPGLRSSRTPGVSPRGLPARALAAHHHVLTDPERHEERADPGVYRSFAA